jgi:CRISPR-associated protein Cmr1
MSRALDRYCRRKRIKLRCTVITPMFLGNADQAAEWRAAPFKSLLRYWWRVTQKDVSSDRQLREREGSLFGCAGESVSNESGKSLVTTAIFSEEKWSRERLKYNETVEHPETDRRNIDPLLYLGGMGILQTNGDPKHSYFPVNSKFDWEINYPASHESSLDNVLALVCSFGTIGSRCRNGWGSFQLHSEEGELASPSILSGLECDWRQSFVYDYPHCLGHDGEGSLLWKTTKAHADWKAAMHELADAYISVRARAVANIEKLDPGGSNNASERHLLGIPLTHHNAWSNQARHASPLRFVLRRQPDGHRGFILHLPHGFSQKMAKQYPKLSVEYQISVWEKVHNKFDKIPGLERAQYKDCI